MKYVADTKHKIDKRNITTPNMYAQLDDDFVLTLVTQEK